MQLLKSVSSLLFNTTLDSSDMIQLEGTLYLNHSDRVRGQHECLYPEAQIILRRTRSDYEYELIITRVYNEDDFDEEVDPVSESKVFSVSEAMQFHLGEMEGSPTIRWIDPNEASDIFEFVLSEKTSLAQMKAFKKAMLCSIYEEKFRKLHTYASESELEKLVYVPKRQTKATPAVSTDKKENLNASTKGIIKPQVQSSPLSSDKKSEMKTTPPKAHTKTSLPPTASELPKFAPLPGDTTLDLELDADFFLFNAQTYSFEQHLDKCTVQLHTTRHPDQSFICVCHHEVPILNQSLEMSMNHSFHLPDYAFVWNYSDVVCFSMALKFDCDPEYHSFRKRFTELYMQATLHQSLLQMKLDDQDYNYLMQQRSSKSELRTQKQSHMEEALEVGDESEEEEADELVTRASQSSSQAEKNSAKNSLLNVGRYQTYVVRGNQLGVFGYTNKGGVVYKTTVPITFAKKEVNPTKALLHQSESKFIFTDEHSQPNTVFQMDLETQKIVRDWNLDSDHNMQLRDLVNPTKHATDPTLVGILNKALVTMDPRAPQVVQWNQAQTYKTDVNLNCASTTLDGAIAVGNTKGELRLFDRIGIRAKTQLQGASEPISHLDVSMDGTLVLATCQSHLLLFDVTVKDRTGFHTRMSQEEKPTAIRLQLSPEDVVKLQAPVHFRKAHFDGQSKATFIVSSTSNYIVSWNVDEILAGSKYNYKLKRADDVVVDDQFKQDDSQRIIMALPDDVKSVSRSTLKGARAIASSSSHGRSSR